MTMAEIGMTIGESTEEETGNGSENETRIAAEIEIETEKGIERGTEREIGNGNVTETARGKETESEGTGHGSAIWTGTCGSGPTRGIETATGAAADGTTAGSRSRSRPAPPRRTLPPRWITPRCSPPCTRRRT